MTILMLSEYFFPYDFGGSEWSTFYLAKGLEEKANKVIILTPSYGSKKYKEKSKVEVIRFPFYKKITKNQLTPFWQTNILWNFWTSICVLYFSIKKNADVIHVQGKYFLPAAVFTKFVTRKKIVVTLRDYIILCPLGMCILKRGKKCSLKEFLFQDIPTYLKIYNAQANLWTKSLIAISAIRGKVVSQFLFFLLNFSNETILLSNVQKKVFMSAKIKKLNVIPNSIETISNYPVKKSKEILYAGRLTPGKGVSIFVTAVTKILRKNEGVKVAIYGEGFLAGELKSQIKKLRVVNRIKIYKKISHAKLLQKISKVTMTVIPSVWPEPFGRLALESLSAGTPVVITYNTGSSSYIKNKRWGIKVKPNIISLQKGIEFCLRNTNVLTANIKSDRKNIENLFSKRPVLSYINIYQNLI